MNSTKTYEEVTEILKEESIKLSNITLSERQLCDLELILNGGFHPLKSYLNKKDYESVLDDMRLSTGELWPIPITLDVSKEFIDDNNIEENTDVSIRDKEGFIIAILTITDIWKADKNRESQTIYGTTDENHPGDSLMKIILEYTNYYIKLKNIMFLEK